MDEHSNALIIQATEQDQQRIIRLVDNLDRPRPQVHLKAYIVEATKETARELGVHPSTVGRWLTALTEQSDEESAGGTDTYDTPEGLSNQAPTEEENS